MSAVGDVMQYMSKWEMVRLGDVAIITAGQGAPQGEANYSNTGTPFIKAGNLYELINGSKEYCIQRVSEEVAKNHKLKLFPKGTVVFAKSGMSCMKGYIYELMNPCYVVNHLACIALKNDLPRYLKYFLERKPPNLLIKDDSYPSISLSDVAEIQIPLPPLPIQQKIADVLDRANALIDKRKAQIEKLDLLVKSQFIEMFGDPVTNPMGWERLSWNNLFNTTTGKLDSNAMVEGGIYPFFTCAKEIYQIDTYAFDCEALILAGNNAAAIYDVKHYSGKFNAYQRTYVITLRGVNNSYNVFKVLLEQKLERMRDMSKGTNTKYLTLGILESFDFIVPPLALQTQFAAFVERVEVQKARMKQGLELMELEYKSLMQKCFYGELY